MDIFFLIYEYSWCQSFWRHKMSSHWDAIRTVQRRKNIRPHQCYGFFDPRIILNSHHVRVFSTRGFERSEVDNYTSLAPIDFERLPPRSPLSFGRSLLLMEGKKNTTPTSTLLFLCFTFLYNFFLLPAEKERCYGKTFQGCCLGKLSLSIVSKEGNI